MKYRITTTKRFDKAFLRCVSRGYDITKLRNAITAVPLKSADFKIID